MQTKAVSEKSTPSWKSIKRYSSKEQPATKAETDGAARKTHTAVENLPVSTVKGFNQKEEYSQNLVHFSFLFQN